MSTHQNIDIRMGELMTTFYVGALHTVKTSMPVRLFEHQKANCRPLATKSREYFCPDLDFVSAETKRLLHQSLIEPRNSPWRA